MPRQHVDASKSPQAIRPSCQGNAVDEVPSASVEGNIIMAGESLPSGMDGLLQRSAADVARFISDQSAMHETHLTECLLAKFVPFLASSVPAEAEDSRCHYAEFVPVLRTMQTAMLSNKKFCAYLLRMSNQTADDFRLIGENGTLEILLKLYVRTVSHRDAHELILEALPLVYRNLKDHRDIQSEADIQVICRVFEDAGSTANGHREILSLLRVMLECRPRCAPILSKSMILRDYPSIYQGCPSCGFQVDGSPVLLHVMHENDFVGKRSLAMECVALLLTHLPLSTWMHQSRGVHAMWSFQNRVSRAVEDVFRIAICKPFHRLLAVALLRHTPFQGMETMGALGTRLIEKACRQGLADDLIGDCLGGRLDSRGRLECTPSPVSKFIEIHIDFSELHMQPGRSVAVLRALPDLIFGSELRMNGLRFSLGQIGSFPEKLGFCEALLSGRKLMVDAGLLSAEKGRLLIADLVDTLNDAFDQDKTCRQAYCTIIGLVLPFDWNVVSVDTGVKCLEHVLDVCDDKRASTKDQVESMKALGQLCLSLIPHECDRHEPALGDAQVDRIAATLGHAKTHCHIHCMALFAIGNFFQALTASSISRGLLNSSNLPCVVQCCRVALQDPGNYKIYSNAMRAGCRLTAWLVRHMSSAREMDPFVNEVLQVCSTSLKSACDAGMSESKKEKQVVRYACSSCHSLTVLFSCGLLSHCAFHGETLRLSAAWLEAMALLDRVNAKLKISLMTTAASLEVPHLIAVASLVDERLWTNALCCIAHTASRGDQIANDMESVSAKARSNMFSASSPRQVAVAIEYINSQDDHAIARLVRYPLSIETLRAVKSALSDIKDIDVRVDQTIYSLLRPENADDGEEL